MYGLYLVAQTDTEGAHVSHRAVSHLLLHDRVLDGATSNLAAVVAYLQRAFVEQAWNDPVCGDGVCEAPYETPGTNAASGCPADCGMDTSAVRAVVRIAADFRHHRVPEDAIQPRGRRLREGPMAQRAPSAPCRTTRGGGPRDDHQAQR